MSRKKQKRKNTKRHKQLHQLLCNEFGIDKYSQFEKSFRKHMQSENYQLVDEVADKIPSLQNQFGNGAFICSFARGTHVKQKKFYKSTNSTITGNVKYKSFCDGKYEWISYIELQRVFGTDGFKDFQVKDFESPRIIAFIFFDFPKKMECVITHFLFRRFNNKKLKYYAQINIKSLLKEFQWVLYHIKMFRLQSEWLNPMTFAYICELHWFILNTSSEKVSVENSIRIIMNRYFPKELLIKIVMQNKLDYIQEKHEIGMQNKLNYIHEKEMENILIGACNEYIQTSEFLKDLPMNSTTNGIYHLHVVFMTMLIIYTEIFQSEQDLVGIVYSTSDKKYKEYVESSITAQSTTTWDIGDATYFGLRLYGRKCANCKILECREKHNIQWFKKCAQCQIRNYCSKKCQKIHWKNKHRLECKSINV